ncbi:hypothetical protein Q0590_26555 [Rhodocytophaga aerolata]|uniref:Uncharacterized protein n=1 Tax=Rhodocytophaga aerolata TaxID=455078 RepID=A0ABT8RCY3_9BACT|nr:hypothetical protein [Rhodocytophaga aerolata]MDO1449869.1 hypothetical protein [Rhodocytophaga aerolata]
MLPFKKLTVHYFSPANRFYKAKLEQNNQISTLSQEEALKLIASTTWTSTESKQISDNKRLLIEKIYLLTLAP